MKDSLIELQKLSNREICDKITEMQDNLEFLSHKQLGLLRLARTHLLTEQLDNITLSRDIKLLRISLVANHYLHQDENLLLREVTRRIYSKFKHEAK